MNVPKGYDNVEEIYQSGRTKVFRARESESKRSVVIKTLSHDATRAHDRVALRREYELARSLDLPGVIRAYALVDESALVLEDIGGRSLKHLVGTELPLAEFLPLALRIVDALAELHAAHVVHKDIKPTNIIANHDLRVVKITDLSISSMLSREPTSAASPRLLEGTLAYMSPEQTGRMNRAVDLRSDLYALGVTFYELLTGEVPFQSGDANEVLYAHVARRPVAPHERTSRVPLVVSRIVMKLLEKAPENRYQSAHGLRADLAKCLTLLENDTITSDFELGTSDDTDVLRISETLFGREEERRELASAYEKLSAGERSFVLIGGAPGIGKTALVRELYQHLPQQQAILISGKYDQLRQDTPFAGLLEALG